MTHRLHFPLFMLALFTALTSGCADSSTEPSDDDIIHQGGQVGWIAGVGDGGYGVLLHTSDYGATWTRQGDSLTIPNTSFSKVHAYSDQIAWAAGSIADDYGVLMKTTDGGQTWTRMDSAYMPDGDISAMSVVDENTVWAVGQNNTILLTTDGGASWTSMADAAYDSIDLSDVVAADANNVWICGGGVDGLILHSTDGGATWRSEADDQLTEHTLISMSVVNEDRCWAVGHGGTVLRTTDGGDTWLRKSPMGEVILDVNGVCAINASQVWVVMDYDNIYYSGDNGENWTQQTSPNSGYYLLRVNAINELNVWISGSAHTPPFDGVLLHTTDAGSTWTNIDYPTDAALWDVDFVGSYH